jgi:phytoene synthase
VTLRRAIPKPYVQELLLGMQMDVEDTRYETLPDLLLYCHRVAGVVGLMMCHVLGARTQASLANAVHLGVAMQLTNICRDVAEDAQRGRTYLPARWLAADPTASVVARLLDEADRYYRSGERGIIALPFRAALAVRTARHVYAAIGSELRRRGCDVSAGRARVPGWRKLWWVGVSLLQSLAELPARLRPARTTNLSLVRYEDVLPL